MNGAQAKKLTLPAWSYLLAAAVFICMQLLFHQVVANAPNPPPPVARVFLGLLTGAVLAAIMLLAGYVNGDARRRGMNPLLWTLIVIFVPNAIGIILYFVLRKPVQIDCPGCGQPADPSFSFCPNCRRQLVASCPQCGRPLRTPGPYCPHCGAALKTAAAG